MTDRHHPSRSSRAGRAAGDAPANVVRFVPRAGAPAAPAGAQAGAPAPAAETVECCVCHRPVAPADARYLAGRAFCAAHFARVGHERRSATAPIVFEIGALVFFAGAAVALTALIGGALDGALGVAASVLLALVPSALWLIAFYRQDRVEPEPKRYVLGVALLSGVLAAAVGQPLLRDVFQVGAWLHDSPVAGVLGSIFVVGMVQEFLKYAAVRYTVFNTAEFDERVDGIIYGAAAGLGYAAATNLAYVLGHGGVNLGAGAVQVSVNALAHASFSAVVGYFLARAKFEAMGPFWLPGGLLLAAVLDGLVSFALREVPMLDGFAYRPWLGLVLAAAVATATFAGVYAVIHRLNAATLRQAHTPAPH